MHRQRQQRTPGSRRAPGAGERPALSPSEPAKAAGREFIAPSVLEPGWTADKPDRVLEGARGIRTKGRTPQGSDAAHASPQFCDAFAGPGRRSTLRADDAGTFRHLDDANLHARGRGAAETSL